MSRRLPSSWLPRHWYLPRHLRHPLARYRLAPSVAAALAAAGAAALAGCGSAAAPGAAGGAGTGVTASASGAASASGTASGGAGGGAGGTASGTASPSGTASSPASGVSSCTASGLRVRLDTAAAGVAAGSSFVPLEFTNISGQACELAGYPTVALTMGLSGAQVGARAATDRAVPAGPVVLAPGGIAHAWLQVLSTASYPASKCHPVTAAGLRITVPGTASASYVAHPVPACTAVLRGSEMLTVRPVQRGPARRGTA
jgi:Protein of unknown function (DUF4232)